MFELSCQSIFLVQFSFFFFLSFPCILQIDSSRSDIFLNSPSPSSSSRTDSRLYRKPCSTRPCLRTYTKSPGSIWDKLWVATIVVLLCLHRLSASKTKIREVASSADVASSEGEKSIRCNHRGGMKTYQESIRLDFTI